MSDEPRKPGEMTEGSGEPVNPVDYAAGDLVVLRSGGPMLAIASVSGQFAHCIWFTPED